MGGESAEREVSLASGRGIADELARIGYTVVEIDAGRDLAARVTEAEIDLAFIALHGGAGENGAVQGMFEVMGMPYTGSGILASAAAMDKAASKILFARAGLRVPGHVVVDKDSAEAFSADSIGFPLPYVVKPAAEGSSIGVCIVNSEPELQAALADAFRYGSRALVEEYVKGKEIQIGVLRNRTLGGVEVRPKKAFYDYECKYTKGMTEYILPPEIPDDVLERLKDAALRAHRALGCSVYSRVDFLVDSTGREYVLEVNTLPGMTPTSLMPKIAALAGMSFGMLLEEIIGASIEERKRR
ncbi:MAG: D-alanine--D-alanine ligase [Nitrospirae bacterium]|nr:D-alanine--D-alanine ligase [Nitrospirota bacterium]